MLHLVLALILSCARDQPDINALIASGRAKQSQSDKAGARELYEQAWAEIEKGPAEDPRRYDIAKLLAGIHTMLGEYPKAEEYLQLAIAWREAVNGKKDPKLPDEFVELAVLCYREKDYPRGLQLLRQAMQRQAELDRFDSLPVADILSRMAVIHLGQENYSQAAWALESALDIRAKISGADHSSLLPDLDRLATTRVKMRSSRYLHGDRKQGETLYRQALTLLDPERPEHKQLRELIQGILKAIASETKPAKTPKKG